FCDVFKDKIDPYRGMPVKTLDVVEYLQGALALDKSNPAGNLEFFFKYLDSKDPEVARDAFLELARATDKELGQAAAKFSAAQLRTWIEDASLPAERLNLYAFLLGVSGNDRDAILLQSLLKKSDERSAAAFQGILCGYIQLRPREGWQLAQDTLKDNSKP